MSIRIKYVMAIISFVIGVFFAWIAWLWGLFISTPGQFPLPTNPSGIDFLLLLVLCIIAFTTMKISHYLSKPWNKFIYCFIGLNFSVMILFAVWAMTPLSSCKYFPLNQSKCDEYGYVP